MDYQILPNQQNYTKSWVSYLDLLGFTDFVKTKSFVGTVTLYEQVCGQAISRASNNHNVNIEITWFSDTFLLYSPDNTESSFVEIEAATHSIIDNLIRRRIPVRGAMSCCNFAADKKNNAFFGPALIKAYHYGENQNWIGFVLTPSAVNQMDAIGLPANNRAYYAYWDIPYKKAVCCASAHKDTRVLQKSLPAYIIGGHYEINGRNLCLDKLHEMKTNLKCDKLINKYENTINFIKKNQRAFPPSC